MSSLFTRSFKAATTFRSSCDLQMLGFKHNVKWLEFGNTEDPMSGKTVRHTERKYFYYNAGTNMFTADDDQQHFINCPWLDITQPVTVNPLDHECVR